VDRLYRSVGHALSGFEIMSYQGIKLHSVTEGQKDFIDLLINSLGAQLYANSVADHTRRAL
jgi:DNA invertase Pin-like site-specific DNA recombinase